MRTQEQRRWREVGIWDAERKSGQKQGWWHSQGWLAGPGQTHRVSVVSPPASSPG